MDTLYKTAWKRRYRSKRVALRSKLSQVRDEVALAARSRLQSRQALLPAMSVDPDQRAAK